MNCKKNKTIKTLALIDSGAGGEFIDQNYAKESSFTLKNLEEPLMARKMDGMENKQGKITKYVNLNVTIHGRTKKHQNVSNRVRKEKNHLRIPMVER